MKKTLLFLVSSCSVLGLLASAEKKYSVSAQSHRDSLITSIIKAGVKQCSSSSKSILKACSSPVVTPRVESFRVSPTSVARVPEISSPVRIGQQVSFNNENLKNSKSKDQASSPELLVLPLLKGPAHNTNIGIQACISPDCGEPSPESDAGTLRPESSSSSLNNLMRVHPSQRSMYDCGGFDEGSPDSSPEKDVLTRLRSTSDVSLRVRRDSNDWIIGSGSIYSVSPGTPKDHKRIKNESFNDLSGIVESYRSNDWC